MNRTGGTGTARRLVAGLALASFFLSFAPVPAGADAGHHCPPPAGLAPVLALPADHDCHASQPGLCTGAMHCLTISAAVLGAAPAWSTPPSEAAGAPAGPPALHDVPLSPPTPPPNN